MKNSPRILGVWCFLLVFSFGKTHAGQIKTVTISAMKNSVAHHMAMGVVLNAYKRQGIHEKNRPLAYRLETVLKDMELDGLIEKIWEKARQEILSKADDFDD